MAEDVKNGRNFIIFPEGTRSRDGNHLLPFKGGSFKCATKANCPIVPVALLDSYKAFDTGSVAKQIVQVHFLDPIYPGRVSGDEDDTDRGTGTDADRGEDSGVRDGKKRINLQKKRDTTVRRNTAAAVSLFSLQKGSDMEQTAGKQSISFIEPVHIISSASVVGPKEGEGPLGDGFDLIASEADFGEETWEQAGEHDAAEALQLAIGKAGLRAGYPVSVRR